MDGSSSFNITALCNTNFLRFSTSSDSVALAKTAWYTGGKKLEK